MSVALDRLFELLAEMKKVTLEPKVVTYNSFNHASTQGKELNLGLGIFRRMLREKVAPESVTLCSLIDFCGLAGEVELAFQTIEALLLQFSYLRPNFPKYNELLQECSEAG